MIEPESDSGSSMNLRTVPPVWLDWILGLSMKGASRDVIIERCREKGLTNETTVSLLDSLEQNPLFDCLLRNLEAKAKSDSLLRLLTTLQKKRDESVRVIEVLTKEQFVNEHVYAHRPALLTDVLRPLCESRDWSPRSLAADFGSNVVKVTIGNRWIKQPPYRTEIEPTPIAFHEFVDSILKEPDSDTMYLTSEDRLFAQEGFKHLFEDSLFECDLLDCEQATPETVKIWIGPRGTRTPMHHDRVNVLLAQLYGSKRVLLYPSAALARMGNDFGCYSSNSFEAVDELEGLQPYEVEVAPGKALFIPAGWWHDVTAMDASVTITYDNLAIDKDDCSWLGVYWIRNCPKLINA